MARFWFEIMIPTFGEDNIELLYSGISNDFSFNKFVLIKCCFLDTDSYYVEFQDWMYEEVLTKLEPYIDFSNFPSDHPRFSNARKAQFGYVKVDTADAVIHAFVGEKKKSYQIFTNHSVTEINDLDFDRKTCKKGECN